MSAEVRGDLTTLADALHVRVVELEAAGNVETATVLAQERLMLLREHWRFAEERERVRKFSNGGGR